MNKEIINVVIIEDQLENIKILKFFLDQYSDKINVRFIGKDGQEAEEILVRQDFDLAFVDIDLGEESIFDVLSRIDHSHLDQKLVFVTAHGSFENALRAIRYSCLNFITKPIDFDELKKTIEQVLSDKQMPRDSRIETLLNIFNDDVLSPKRIGIHVQQGIVQFVECTDIIYISASEVLSTVYLINKKSINSTRSLGHYIKLLSGHKDFIQIHKSTIINLNQIEKFDARKRILVMKNKEELDVSRRQLNNVRNVMDRLFGLQ